MADSVVVFASTSVGGSHAQIVERIHAAATAETSVDVQGPPCRTTTPEVHGRGEFPMDCWACHEFVNYA